MKVAKYIAVRPVPPEHRPKPTHGIGVATCDINVDDFELVEFVTIDARTARTLAQKLLDYAEDLDDELSGSDVESPALD